MNFEQRLITACHKNDIKAIVSLLENKDKKDFKWVNWALRQVCSYEDTKIASLLLAHPEVQPEASQNILFRNAIVHNSHINYIKLLLDDDRINPNDRDGEALWNTIHQGRIDVVNLLLSYSKVNPGCGDNCCFTLAALEGHREIVKILAKDKRVDPSVRANLVLRKAVDEDDTEIINLLLGRQEVIDTIVKNNQTELWEKFKDKVHKILC